MKMKLILCFLAAAMVFNMIAPVSTGYAAVSSTFNILADASGVKTGKSFSITVSGKDVQNMYACEVRLTFDNSLLKFNGISSSIQGYKFSPTVGENESKILFTVAKSANQLPENGDVTLCTLTFTGKAEGKARVTLNTVKLMDEILKSTDYNMEKTIEVSITAGGPHILPPLATPTPTPTTTPTPNPTPTPMPTPVTIIYIEPNLIPFDAATGIARVDLGVQAEDIFSGTGISVIKVPPIPKTNGYTLEIPAGSISGTLGEGLLNFSTELGDITVSNSMLAGIPDAVGKEIGITIGMGNKSGLLKDLKKAVDTRPLVQLTLTLDGVQAGWNNPNAPVTVSIPYKPKKEELADPEHIVVWYIDGEGNAVSVPNGRYDPETGMVTFTTTHFSYYAIAYVHKTFSDLDSVPWAKKPIEVMASKGIITGMGGDTYSPSLNITRADYLLLVVRILGLWAEVEDNFDDVKPGDYYYESVGIAKKLGITDGDGNNRFNPKESISRQDMMVLTARALKKFRELKLSDDTGVLDPFTDRGDIAGYAVRSAAALVKKGFITGSGNSRLNPRGCMTRAEAAVLLYRIYKY